MEKENPISSTAQRIVDRCFVAFNQFGFAAVSMDSISKELKISKKTIYKHCASKEELLELALSQTLRRVEEKLAKNKRQESPKSAFSDFFEVWKFWRMAVSLKLRTDLIKHLPHQEERLVNFERQVLLRSLAGSLKDFRSEGLLDYPSPTREFAAVLLRVMDSLVDANTEQAQMILASLARGLSPKKKKK
ncbi:MAG: hypothetical protein RLZZ519_2842 [Bacteroidota bacterium]|jgi:AcrR family transcriptional regulator